MFGNPGDTLIYRKRPYNKRRSVAALGGGAAVIAWILATGFWNDAAPWDDIQLWKDS